MKIDANDPKWTAYALGEISDETERAEIESILKESAEMRKLVEEIRQTAGFLKAELQAEPAMDLTQAQRERIEQKAIFGRNWFGLRPAWAMACAAAAIMLISVVVVKQMREQGSRPPQGQQASTVPNTPVQASNPAQSLINKKDVAAATQNTSNTTTIPAKSDKPETGVSTASVPQHSLSQNGSLAGTIMDPSNGVIPGAKITVTDIARQTTKTTLTNSAGRYDFRSLPPGQYKADVEMPGFKKFETALGIDRGGQTGLTVKMELGTVSESVDVVTASPVAVVGETSPSTGTVLTPEYMTNLPTTSNDVMSLVNTIGGVIPAQDKLLDTDKQMLMGTAAPGIAVIRDGINANEVRWASGTNTPSRINPELVKEFKVALSPTDAELARGAGNAQVKADKKPGKTQTQPGSAAAASTPPNSSLSSESGAGVGIGRGAGIGVGPGQSGGMGGGIGGGIAGGVVGGFVPGASMASMPTAAPPPPPPPAARRPPISDEHSDRAYFNILPPPPPPRPPYYQGIWPPPRYHLGWFSTESYNHIRDNAFLDVGQNPLSTFSIDVDTASYSNMRRFLDNGQFPPVDAIRIEELVNYFDYEYKAPKDGKPFAANFELTEAPWNPSHRLLRIALKGREIHRTKRPNSNLVFLLDISGSMGEPRKLPLVKQSMEMLIDKLTESDRVAIVTYSTDASLYLPPISGDQKARLRNAIEQLQAGGTTNGAGGIQLAYQTAQENFIKGGINRVILATDGDFNVGITDRGSLTQLIEQKADSGIFLSALGYGMGNLKDATLELLADKGRGNYAYIDSLQEAQKVLVDQMDATLVAIAKDVKIQVEFNPVHVSSYRLIGYEDRIMAKEDFNNDAKKAGVIGAGHQVTALYEIVPSGTAPTPGVDPLKYQKQPQPSQAAHSDEVVTVKVRSKDPEKDTSVLSEFAIKESEAKFSQASPDFKFAASVAAFGMILRNSPYKGSADFMNVLNWATAGKGEDAHGYRAEFLRLVRRAMSISF
jgi:Ca-activated chloride channel homolog